MFSKAGLCSDDVEVLSDTITTTGVEVLKICDFFRCSKCGDKIVATDLVVVAGDVITHKACHASSSTTSAPASSSTTSASASSSTTSASPASSSTTSAPASSSTTSEPSAISEKLRQDLLKEAALANKAAEPACPKDGAGIKAALKRKLTEPAAKSRSKEDDYDEASKRHQELVQISKKLNHSTPKFSARYEPRLPKGASWYRCRHAVQARLDLGKNKIAKSFPFEFGKDGTDAEFEQVCKAAIASALVWREESLKD